MPPLATPESWAHDGLTARLLQPLGWCYAAAASARRQLTTPQRAPVPVLCVGNLVTGGAGKTPVALGLARRLQQRDMTPHFLSRGYGGTVAGPQRVDRARHDARDVGDEPLLLAAAAPTWVARDRVAGAFAAAAAGASVIVMDDGFQNPTIVKDLSLVVVDGGYGFGNGHVMPAGPLREPIGEGLARADAVVLVGDDERGTLDLVGATPVLRGALRPTGGEELRGRRVVAFAGIGRPAKFFGTLEEMAADLVARHAFADHHPYTDAELDALTRNAERAGALLVTTEKDAARLSPSWRAKVAVLPVAVAWQDEAALDALLDRKLGSHG